MSLDGGDLRAVTHEGLIALSPSWSPDSRALLFTSYRTGNPSLFEIDVAGGPPRLVSAQRGLNLGGRFSPVQRDVYEPRARRNSPRRPGWEISSYMRRKTQSSECRRRKGRFSRWARKAKVYSSCSSLSPTNVLPTGSQI